MLQATLAPPLHCCACVTQQPVSIMHMSQRATRGLLRRSVAPLAGAWRLEVESGAAGSVPDTGVLSPAEPAADAQLCPAEAVPLAA